LVPQFGRYTLAAERHDAEIAALADKTVVVMTKCESSVGRLLELLQAKDMPLHIIGGEKPTKVKPTAPPPEPEVRRGLPD
jgi:hypothetical protein